MLTLLRLRRASSRTITRPSYRQCDNPTWSHTAFLSRFHARCRSPFRLHNRRSRLLGVALWRPCNLTSFSPCLTGPVEYLFASCHKGSRFKSPGGYLCETGILLLAMSRYIYIYIIYIHTYKQHICCHFTRKTEAMAIFLHLFSVCSSYKRKFVVCPFVDEETNGSYLFSNGLNGINGLARLWYLLTVFSTFVFRIKMGKSSADRATGGVVGGVSGYVKKSIGRITITATHIMLRLIGAEPRINIVYSPCVYGRFRPEHDEEKCYQNCRLVWHFFPIKVGILIFFKLLLHTRYSCPTYLTGSSVVN